MWHSLRLCLRGLRLFLLQQHVSMGFALEVLGLTREVLAYYREKITLERNLAAAQEREEAVAAEAAAAAAAAWHNASLF